MKAILAGLMLVSGLASAATLQIYSTGFTAGGGSRVLPGLRDGNWTLESGPGGSVGSPFAPFVTTGSLLSQFPFSSGAWMKDTAASQWVSPLGTENTSNPNSPSVPYVYQAAFSLSNMDLSTVSIVGEWSADNYGYIVVNGVEVGTNGTGADGIIPNLAGEFKSFTSFSLNPSNTYFVAGTNTIQFDVFNNANGSPDVTGVNVHIQSATADGAPEPATFGILGLGLVAMGALGKRASRRGSR